MTEPSRVGAQLVDAATKVGQWAVELDDEIVCLWDLPPGTFDEVYRRTGIRTATIIYDPLMNAEACRIFIEHAARQHDRPVPPLTSTADVIRRIVEVPGDLPEVPATSSGGDVGDPTPASSTV